VKALTHPFVALPLWVVTYAVWHIPALYDAALGRPGSLLALEHATYVVAGILFWWCVWQTEPHRLSSGARAGYVVAAFVSLPRRSASCSLSCRAPIYGFYADAPERVFGLSRLRTSSSAG
jgi:cytochrome c oxidase assembly factor CtaG